MIKRYKENKKIMKYTLKQEKEARNSAIDGLELQNNIQKGVMKMSKVSLFEHNEKAYKKLIET